MGRDHRYYRIVVSLEGTRLTGSKQISFNDIADNTIFSSIMALILDGSSEIGAHESYR